jgi:hypothetical protein
MLNKIDFAEKIFAFHAQQIFLSKDFGNITVDPSFPSVCQNQIGKNHPKL